MLVVIYGGSGSGKSAYAEEYITGLSGESQKYYIATMQVYGEEGEKKVQKHRKMREGKGFLTLEQPKDLEGLAGPEDTASTALLECMSNLIANEMFSGETPVSRREVTEKVMRGVEKLQKCFRHLVVVSNNVFEDGIVYEETTMEYIRTMGEINQRLALLADRVIEVVAGIPVVIKEAKQNENA